jgi:hypothetical protein
MIRKIRDYTGVLIVGVGSQIQYRTQKVQLLELFVDIRGGLCSDRAHAKQEGKQKSGQFRYSIIRGEKATETFHIVLEWL